MSYDVMRPPSVSTSGGSVSGSQAVPQFFFPKKQQDESRSLASRISHALALADLDRVALMSEELAQLATHLETLAVTAPVSSFQQRLLVTYASPTTGSTLVDRFIRERKTLSLSYDDYRSIALGEWKCAPSTVPKLKRLLTAQCFLSLMHPSDRSVNALDLLAYLSEVQLSIRIACQLGELVAVSAANSVTEREYAAFISRAIQLAIASKTVDVPPDLVEYYQLICTRALVLPHLVGGSKSSELASLDQLADCTVFRAFVRFMDVDMRSLFDSTADIKGATVYGCRGFFDPAMALTLHKQYLQLDADRNGLLSVSELGDFGKKRAFLGPNANSGAGEPTHDLTRAFVAQVFCHVPFFDGELDYRGYIDFALVMMDKSSTSALRFFWDVLDFQQQGFLDTFTLDFFLRSLTDKIRSHRAASGGDDDHDESNEGNTDKSSVPTVEQLRTQVLDVIGPANPARVTWTDLCRCRVGHTVVRILTDYVAYRAYENSGGRLPAA